jgi:hypothetical protein
MGFCSHFFHQFSASFSQSDDSTKSNKGVAYHGRWRFDVAGLMPREIG